MSSDTVCTVCNRAGMAKYYGNRTGRKLCSTCYHKARKLAKPKKAKSKIYDMWGG